MNKLEARKYLVDRVYEKLWEAGAITRETPQVWDTNILSMSSFIMAHWDLKAPTDPEGLDAAADQVVEILVSFVSSIRSSPFYTSSEEIEQAAQSDPESLMKQVLGL